MPDSGETISVRCSCGKKLKAPASAAGRKAKCPACGNVVRFATAPPPIPTPQPQPAEPSYNLAEDPEPPKPAATADTGRCPQCGLAVAPGAVLCVNCGFNFRTGKKLAAAETTAAMTPAEAMSTHASAKDSKTREEAPYTPWWTWLFVVACVAIPVVTLGGAIPGAIGCGSAGACFSTARQVQKSAGMRIGICVAITIGAWVLFIALIGGIAALRR